MNLKKRILSIVLLISFLSFSQNDKCIIYFKDGTKLEGLGKLKSNGQVKFRLDKESDKQNYHSSIISKIQFINYKVTTFEYKVIDDLNSEWLELIIKGKVSLYTISINHQQMGMNGGMSFGNTTTYYFTCHNNDSQVYRIASVGTISRSFKKTASDFFKDCPKIVKKIHDETYKKDDLKRIVIEYNNSDCNSIEVN